MQTILVTGSTGNVGREVVKELIRLGQTVRAAVLEPGLADVEGAPAVPFNFRQPETWPAALADVRGIFLMRPPDMVDVDATLVPFLTAARAQGVKHVTFLSLIGVDKNKRIPHYGVEQALLKAGMDYTFVRPGFFMQNANTAYRDDIRFRNEIVVPAGKGRLALIDVRDIGAVAAKSLAEPGHGNKIYSITGSESLSFDEVAAQIGQAVGRTVRYTRPSTSAFRTHQRKLGAAEDYIDVMNSIYFPVRMKLAGGISDEFAKIMGRPPIRFAQYAADYAAQWAPPSAEERAAYAAKLAAIPEPPREGWFASLRDRFGGGGMGRIGA